MPDPKSYWFDPDVIFGSGISCLLSWDLSAWLSATDPYKKTKKKWSVQASERASEQASNKGVQYPYQLNNQGIS